MGQAVSTDIARQQTRLVRAKTSGFAQWRTPYIGAMHVDALENRPQAFLDEVIPDATITPHFHRVDQFIVVVGGSGILGRKPLATVAVQYTDHHTAYGPIVSGPLGLAFFTVRARSDPGGIHLHQPGYREKLEPTKKRYLVAQGLGLSVGAVLRARRELSIEPLFPDADTGDGLGASVVRLGPDMQFVGPSPAATDGQFCLVLNGSLLLRGESFPVWSTLHASPVDDDLAIRAGPDGAEVLLMCFPRPEA